MKNQNPFIYSLDNKRYHTLNYYNKQKFHEKIYKAVIDAGFTCPNKDGSVGNGGCIFCDEGSGYFTETSLIPIEEQIQNELYRIHKKTPNAKAIAYFQANTNTYAPLKKLKIMYNKALNNPYICGISIGTRADCLPDDILEYLGKLSEGTNLTVELGLQTIHDKTAEFINRCYSFSVFMKSYKKLKSLNIRTCIHLINGLPYETESDMLKTAEAVGLINPDAVKIQLLHVIRGTKLEKMYNNHAFNAMNKENYIDITVKQLEYMPPETVIERITGDGDKSKLVAPLWSNDKVSILGGIDSAQVKNNSFQGKKYKKALDL